MFALPAGWKPFLLGAAAGTVGVLFFGFSGAGWQTATAADRVGHRQAEHAVIATLAAICEARFKRQADFPARLAALEKVQRFNRGENVRQAGWATLPGTEQRDGDVSRACAELLFPEANS